MDGHGVVQPDQRDLRLRAPLAAHRRAHGRVGLRRRGHLRLVRHPHHGRDAARRHAPRDARAGAPPRAGRRRCGARAARACRRRRRRGPPGAAAGRPGGRVDGAVRSRARRGRPRPVGARRGGERSVDGPAAEPVDRLGSERQSRSAARPRAPPPRRHRPQRRGGRSAGRRQRSRAPPSHRGTARRAAGTVPRDRCRVRSGRADRAAPTRCSTAASRTSSSGPGLHIDYRAERDGPVVGVGHARRGQPHLVGPLRRRHRPVAVPRGGDDDADRPPHRPARARARQRGRMHLVDRRRGHPAHRSFAVVGPLLRLRHEAGSDDDRPRRRRSRTSSR